MSPPLVVICALRGRLFPEVEAAVAEQWPEYAVHLDEPHPLASYADFMRTVWAGPGDLVIVEGDSIPPPASIAGLLACERPWCAHQSWVGDRYLPNTLALVKFSAGLREVLPHLADIALAKEPYRGNRFNRGLGEFQPKKHLGVVPLEASVLKVWPELAAIAWERSMHPGTTAHPKAIDMRLDYELTKARVAVHVHQPPAPHLRYGNDPAWAVSWPESLPAELAGSGRIDVI